MASSPIEVEDKFKIMRHKSQWGSRDLCKGNPHRGEAASPPPAHSGLRPLRAVGSTSRKPEGVIYLDIASGRNGPGGWPGLYVP